VRSESGGRKARPITDVTSIALGKKKWLYACKLFWTNSFKEGAMWYVDPLLDNALKINNYKTAAAK
jgi:hypothetical protein